MPKKKAARERDQELRVEVVGERLVISVGVGTLAWAVRHSPDERLVEWDSERAEFLCYEITDPDGFAKDVVRALDREDDIGTTPVHRLLDDAFVYAIEDGSLHVAEKMTELTP